MRTSTKSILFCLILDLSILATIAFVAYFTKTAWSLWLLIALQKPDEIKEPNREL